MGGDKRRSPSFFPLCARVKEACTPPGPRDLSLPPVWKASQDTRTTSLEAYFFLPLQSRGGLSQAINSTPQS